MSEPRNKLWDVCAAMFRIGMIGFGGGNALIPVIEKTAVKEKKVVTKSDYDTDVMIASITPGALPVEIAGGIGKRVAGISGMLVSAVAMALPGVLFSIIFFSVLISTAGEAVTQIRYVMIGISAFICCLLTYYIKGTVDTAREDVKSMRWLVVILGVAVLTCDKNLTRIILGYAQPIISLDAVSVFVMAFFAVFYTRCQFTKANVAITAIVCVIYTMCCSSAHIIKSAAVRDITEVLMLGLGIYGLSRNIQESTSSNERTSIRKIICNVLKAFSIPMLFTIPAFLIYPEAFSFVVNGYLSSVMSFGGGDAYLTVADGLFVQAGVIDENVFYSSVVPVVNVLPGSILCKTLSGVGYYIGVNEMGTQWAGFIMAVAGFAVSIAGSCSVVVMIYGIYERYGTLDIFHKIKRLVRPIVSGLLVNVMLSLVYQVQKINIVSELNIALLIMLAVYILDNYLFYRLKMSNGRIAFISVLISLAVCNVAVYV